MTLEQMADGKWHVLTLCPHKSARLSRTWRGRCRSRPPADQVYEGSGQQVTVEISGKCGGKLEPLGSGSGTSMEWAVFL